MGENATAVSYGGAAIYELQLYSGLLLPSLSPRLSQSQFLPLCPNWNLNSYLPVPTFTASLGHLGTFQSPFVLQQLFWHLRMFLSLFLTHSTLFLSFCLSM
jgi:hypothetical protein